MGNPSDGFFGKTIAVTISNYWAEVRRQPCRAACLALSSVAQASSASDRRRTTARPHRPHIGLVRINTRGR